MLSVRNAILAALAIFALSIAVEVVSLMQSPGSQNTAIDSYGTYRDGYRAVFELLDEFKIPAERHNEPPAKDSPTLSTFVFWVPHDDLISNEPVYLQQMLSWVERGGRIVVSVPPSGRTTTMSRTCNSSTCSASKNGDLWTTLGLDGVHTVTIEPSGVEKEIAPNGQVIFQPDADRFERFRRGLEEEFGLHPVKFTSVDAVVSGSFEVLRERIRKLQIPADQVGKLHIQSDISVAGQIEGEFAEGERWTLAASFPRGQGEIIVVAEPMLFMNASISKFDNSAMAYELLASGGRRVIFDEFYHGLSVRGNPLWLLTKRTYATVFLVVLVSLGMVLWRRAILLGPPLETPAKSRRTIIEYVEAMARFLSRGRASRPFLLKEIRAGALRAVGERFGLSPAIHDPEIIAASIARRSLVEANQFREAMHSLDAALAKGRKLSESEAIRVMQRISSCL